MKTQSPYHTFRRYQSLLTDRITILPVVILMPHSACNCRCIMCDIWKGNRNIKQLKEDDVQGLLSSLKKFRTRQVVMSGGEALLHADFFALCSLIKKLGIHITLLSTGVSLKFKAGQLAGKVDDIIVSLDGDEETHDRIRNLPGAFARLKESVQYLKWMDPSFPVSSRTVIHRLNYQKWSSIIRTAKKMGLDKVSFLPADVSSTAFNREQPWDTTRQMQIAPGPEDLCLFKQILDSLLREHSEDFRSGFIAESPEKLHRIYDYYRALNGLGEFPYKKCNAPWVSTVIEADGSVRPCFFHASIGNIREDDLGQILNGNTGMKFRKELDMKKNETCRRCVCSLYLPPYADPVTN